MQESWLRDAWRHEDSQQLCDTVDLRTQDCMHAWEAVAFAAQVKDQCLRCAGFYRAEEIHQLWAKQQAAPVVLRT